MSNSRRTIRRQLLDQIPALGFYGTADSVAAGSIVDTFIFQDSNLSTSQYKGCYILRPDRTGDDRIKKAGALVLASGTLAHTGSNYTNTSDMVYEIIGLLHPDELDACIVRALKRIYFETQVPLTRVTDGDFPNSVANWTGTNANLTAITAAANVYSGIGSMRVANTLANGYAASVAITVSKGEPFWCSAICRSASGTADLVVWDNTNGAVISNKTHTDSQWQRLWILDYLPSTCESVIIRCRGTESDADIYWDSVHFYTLNERRIMAPSWLDEPWKFLKLREAKYARSLATGQDDATTRYLQDWFSPAHFTLDPFQPEVNPYAVQLQRPLPQTDLWIEAKRPYFDLEPLATDSATTTAPLNLILAFSKLELASLLTKRYPQDPKWQQLYREAERETSAETLARPEVPIQPKKYNTLGRI